ncbi:MAG: bifunctional phosphoglucose/phosphomannose isomerase [Candidatus Omnitrophica bacterium]|nr:bifunctional phosphoglucose/phosphomannose isomerase [Candidatus Omnitrophota bacterium]
MKGSLSLQNIKRLDKSNMLELLLSFPLQCSTAFEIARQAKIRLEKREFNKVLFAGLGGSAIGADLVRSYLYFESKIPIVVVREYDLPAFADSSTLFFLTSYSGNTEETISTYRQAMDRGSNIVTISSGGTLKDLAIKDNVSFIQIPQGLPPRCALGYLSIIPLCILARLGLIKEVDYAVRETVRVLDDLAKECLNPSIAQKDNIAKYIASRIYSKFTVIYSSSIHFDVVSTRLRGQLNENSKALASSHVFPEMNHNEIVGWQNPHRLFKNFIVIMLRDRFLHSRVAKRMDITRDILKKQDVEVLEIYSRGEDLLSRIFSLIYIGDFISFYLAMLYGIDPTPVERVTYLKNQLALSGKYS